MRSSSTAQGESRQSFYFDREQTSASSRRTITYVLPRGDSVTLYTDNGVFSKNGADFGTSLLIRTLPRAPRGRSLDLGCGYGVVGVSLALQTPGSDVVMSDVNERAVNLARDNWIRCLPERSSEARSRVILSDGFENIGGRFDLIALNPPVRAGKQTVYALFSECRERLTEGGSLYVVIQNKQGKESAIAKLRELFGPRAVDDIARKAGYHVIRATRARFAPAGAGTDEQVAPDRRTNAQDARTSAAADEQGAADRESAEEGGSA